MLHSEVISEVRALLMETRDAHHDAFASTDGADPDWPLWYAEYLSPPLTQIVASPVTRTQLVTALLALESDHAALSPESSWPDYYAAGFVERFVAEQSETLHLYTMGGCPFCRRVQRVIARLGVDVEFHDVVYDPSALRELVSARGRRTVPVLRCVSASRDRWMAESADIIRYLEGSYGEASAESAVTPRASQLISSAVRDGESNPRHAPPHTRSEE